jgi:hypothetical protein
MTATAKIYGGATHRWRRFFSLLRSARDLRALRKWCVRAGSENPASDTLTELRVIVPRSEGSEERAGERAVA